MCGASTIGTAVELKYLIVPHVCSCSTYTLLKGNVVAVIVSPQYAQPTAD